MLLGKQDYTGQTALLSDHRYLRVHVSGRTLLLVLGYKEAAPDGAIEIWYSAQGEVVKLQRGRIVATDGLSTDWRAVRFSRPPPDWQTLAKHGPLRYTRSRDEMPGYRFGLRDTLIATVIAAPTHSLIRDIAPASLHWIEETCLPSDSRELLPPSRFAFQNMDGRETVVYSEQCLSPTLCLALQRWPVAGGKHR